MDFINKGKKLRTFDKDARNIINTIRDVNGVLIPENQRFYVNKVVSVLKGKSLYSLVSPSWGLDGSNNIQFTHNTSSLTDTQLTLFNYILYVSRL